MHGLYWLTVNLSAAHPVLVCVDDVHWADLPSLRWLAYLARRLDGVRVALLVAGRSAETDADPAEAVLAGLRTEPTVNVLRPAALSEPAVAALARARGPAEPAQAFVRACYELTTGNPFLVGELLRAIAAEGLPLDEASIAQLRRLAPEGVAAAVLLRLSRLPAAATEVARAVAVLEPHAEQRYVSELAGLDEAACATWVDALANMEILAPGRPLSFVHPLIRAAVQTHRGAAERAGAHKRATRLLARAGAGVELVATHLAESEPGGDGWVVEMLVSAASQAVARGAPGAAFAHLRRALEEPPDQRRRGGVLLALGRAGFAAQQPECVGYLREAMTAVEVPTERAAAAVQLGLVLIMAGQAGGAREAAAAARRAGAGDRELELALDELELMAQSTGGVQNELGERLERLGRELAGATQSERTLLSRIALTKAVFAHPVADVLQTIPRMLQAGALEPDPALFGGTRPGLVLAICDELERSDQLLAAYLEYTHGAGLLPWFGIAAATRAIPAFRRGDLALAEASATDALQVSDAMTFAFWIPIALGMLVRALLESGSPERAGDALRRTPSPPQLHAAWPMGYVHHARGLLALAARQPDAALAELERAGEVLLSNGFVNPSVVEWRADAAEDRRQRDRADRPPRHEGAQAAVRPVTERDVPPGCPPQVELVGVLPAAFVAVGRGQEYPQRRARRQPHAADDGVLPYLPSDHPDRRQPPEGLLRRRGEQGRIGPDQARLDRIAQHCPDRGRDRVARLVEQAHREHLGVGPDRVGLEAGVGHCAQNGPRPGVLTRSGDGIVEQPVGPLAASPDLRVVLVVADRVRDRPHRTLQVLVVHALNADQQLRHPGGKRRSELRDQVRVAARAQCVDQLASDGAEPGQPA